jgi:hypothetical protein
MSVLFCSEIVGVSVLREMKKRDDPYRIEIAV